MRYLISYDNERYNKTYDRIRYLISKKSDVQRVLITILQESELIHIILYL